MTIRILFTGAGRRVELLKAYYQAANTLGVDLKIYGADMADTAPALEYCDYIRLVCPMKNPEYIDELLNICIQDKINLLIPTIDTDLLVLSRNKERFLEIGTKVLISDPDKVLICRDKNNTSEFFIECGLKAPLPVNDYLKYEGPYPCFIKPKDGSSSINAFKVNSKEELPDYARRVEDYIIQPFIDGTEYTIDIFCDFDGNPVYIVPRQRIAVRAGEVLKTRITMDESMINEALMLIKVFKPCGPITVQLIKDKNTNDNYYIEINPRYGGGAPLSMKAGAKSAEAVIKLLQNEKLSLDINSIEDGNVYSRFDDILEIITENTNNEKNLKNVKGIIFDLDDTLYPEKDYVSSGYKKISEYLNKKYNIDNKELYEYMWTSFLEKKPAIDEVLNKYNLLQEKEECIRIYQNQDPDIRLYENVELLLKKFRNSGFKIGIITDGRVNGQNNKIEALKLRELVDDIIITDELGGIQFRKPCDISFRIIQNRWRIPFDKLVYIGDNINKDFKAPVLLGMKGILFKNDDSLYGARDARYAGVTIEKLTELEGLFL